MLRDAALIILATAVAVAGRMPAGFFLHQPLHEALSESGSRRDFGRSAKRSAPAEVPHALTAWAQRVVTALKTRIPVAAAPSAGGVSSPLIPLQTSTTAIQSTPTTPATPVTLAAHLTSTNTTSDTSSINKFRAKFINMLPQAAATSKSTKNLILPELDPQSGCIMWYTDFSMGYLLGNLIFMSANLASSPPPPHVDDIVAVQRFYSLTKTALQDTPTKKDVTSMWWAPEMIHESKVKDMEDNFNDEGETSFHDFLRKVSPKADLGEYERMGMACKHDKNFKDEVDIDGIKFEHNMPISRFKWTEASCSPLASLLGLHRSMLALDRQSKEGSNNKGTLAPEPPPELTNAEITEKEFGIAYENNPIFNPEMESKTGCGLSMDTPTNEAFDHTFAGRSTIDATEFTGQMLRVFTKCFAKEDREEMAKTWCMKAERNVNRATMAIIADLEAAADEKNPLNGFKNSPLQPVVPAGKMIPMG